MRNNKRRVGRPCLPKRTVRSERITYLLSPQEVSGILACMREVGTDLSIHEYTRKVVLDHEKRRRRAREKVAG